MNYLEFGEYIEILTNRIKGISKINLVIDLVEAANRNIAKGLSGTTVKNWLDGNNKGYERYFRDDNIKNSDFNDNKFIEYLKTRTNNGKWQNIQHDFKNIGGEHIIDCNTTDVDKFFQSIMYQFKEFFRVPYSPFLEQKNFAELDLNTIRSQSAPIDAEILHNKDPLKRLLREVPPELKKRLATIMPIFQQLNKDDK